MAAKTKETKLYQALISIVVMAALMFVCIVVLDADPQIPLILGCLVAGLVALWAGYTWDDMLDGMIKGITQSLEAILILMLIGVLVGVWIASGTVPTMIYYGLMLINAQYFLVTTMAICSLVAFAIGSWGTVGTIGLAFMGIGLALDVPAPLVAGCVVSGAYFGEIVSPLSDATNLTSAVVGRSVFGIIQKVLPLALVAFALAEIMYFALGLSLRGGDGASVAGNVTPLLDALSGAFNITPVALLPMGIMVACILAKVPAIPAMLAGALAGALVAVGLQGADAGNLVGVSFSGFVGETGQEMLDRLLTAGGLMSMMNAISIVIIAMGFGGLMQSTGQMSALLAPIAPRLKGFAALNGVNSAFCVGMNAILPDQYLGISVPGQMFAEEYDNRGIDRERLGVSLLGAGGVSSPLIPWNTCGIYCMGILGVSAMEYAPFAFFDLLMIVVVVASGVLIGKRAISRPSSEIEKLNQEAVHGEIDNIIEIGELS